MPRLLLVGWDAADWRVMDPLLARGEMPHLAGILAEGVRGNLATIYPPLSPMLWTSIATGKRPAEHGILGFTEPAADGRSVRPISNLGRKTKALWNILNQNGRRSIVVGWWPSHPAEPIRGAMVSEHFKLFPEQDISAPLPRGTIWPPAWAERMADLRVGPMEVTGDILRLFVPDFHLVDQSKDKSLHDLAEIIAECMSVHAAATELLENETWDFAAVYHCGIDHFSHRFMRYHAGKAVRGFDTDPLIYQGVVASAYRYHDLMLGRMLELAGPDCAVMVVSDHGFHSGRLLPDYIPAEAAGPAVEHRHFGMFALRAPGVPGGERVYGANVLDVAPTVLHIFGLPAGLDMPGKVLLNAFPGHSQVAPVLSWDEIAGEDGCHPAERQYDGEASAATLKQLVALGYVAPPGDNARKAVDDCVNENRYNLARALMDAGQNAAAMEILRDLIAGDAEQGRYYQHLFHCALQMGDTDAARGVLADFDRAAADFAPRAAAELERRHLERPERDLNSREPEDKREQYNRRELSEKADGYAGARLLMRCRLALTKARTRAQKEAAHALLDELAAQPISITIRLFLGEGYVAVGDAERALGLMRAARRADPEDWRAMALECRIHLAAGRFAKAANCAIESLALIYYQPALHYALAVSLLRLGDEARAVECLRTALQQAPTFAGAHEELGRILKRQRDFGQAALHMAEAQKLRKQARERRQRPAPAAAAEPPRAPIVRVVERTAEAPMDPSLAVTIVAGLPRSGTSMMMQLLAAGGVEPYTDHVRTPDTDNARGYLEHQNVTRMLQDNSWIAAARGKAVKIVAYLLPALPASEDYRVVFMHRDMDEVMASQRAMLERLGRTDAGQKDRIRGRMQASQLRRARTWLLKRPAIPVLSVEYADALADPSGTVQRVARFLGRPFDEEAAARAVDPSLRRQKSEGEDNL